MLVRVLAQVKDGLALWLVGAEATRATRHTTARYTPPTSPSRCRTWTSSWCTASLRDKIQEMAHCSQRRAYPVCHVLCRLFRLEYKRPVSRSRNLFGGVRNLNSRLNSATLTFYFLPHPSPLSFQYAHFCPSILSELFLIIFFILALVTQLIHLFLVASCNDGCKPTTPQLPLAWCVFLRNWLCCIS